jgi:hypothetical protein
MGVSGFYVPICEIVTLRAIAKLHAVVKLYDLGAGFHFGSAAVNGT